MKSSSRPCKSDFAAASVILAARKKSKLSREALAELAALHRTYISLLERGRRSPTLSTLEAIAHALSLAPSDLIRQIAEASSSATVENTLTCRDKEASNTESSHASKLNKNH